LKNPNLFTIQNIELIEKHNRLIEKHNGLIEKHNINKIIINKIKNNKLNNFHKKINNNINQ
jgi:hypothetical protein